MAIKRNIKTIITGTLIIAVLVFTFVVVEFYESRNELLTTLKNEAVNLSESLSLSFENALIANDEVEAQIVSKLEAVAALVTQSVLSRNQGNKQLKPILDSYQIDHISIIDKNGRVIVKSDTGAIRNISNEFLEMLNPLYSGERSLIDLGIITNEVTGEEMYLIARIGNNRNECVLVGLSAEKILEFRKKVGIGKQIQEIANNQDIVYLFLQDEDGIIAASKGIKEITSIVADEFLKDAYNNQKVKTRMLNYNGKKVFEVVNTVNLMDGSKILNRLALSLDNIMAIQQRSMRRVALIGIGIFILLSVLYAYMLTRKGFSKLKEEHKKIQSYTDLVLENMADAVIAVDKSNTITYYNKTASEIFGISSELAYGKDYNLIFKDDILQLNKALVNKESVLNKETEFIDSNNSKRILELSISFLFDSNNSIDLAIAIIKDLTDKKNYQIQLERKEKLTAMGELAAGVAHEIRNPLNSISVIAQRLQGEFEPKSDTEDYQKLVATVRSETNRVNRIIIQFMEYARPAKLLLTICNINDLIDNCIALIEPEASLKNVSILRDYKNNISMNADTEKMKQVFINLLMNSLESISSGGKIICTTRFENKELEISISDNGSGISQEIQTKIFNLYFTTKPTGNGLGLSIVHQIISEHGGSIKVESLEGSGTEIIIRLPVK